LQLHGLEFSRLADYQHMGHSKQAPLLQPKERVHTTLDMPLLRVETAMLADTWMLEALAHMRTSQAMAALLLGSVALRGLVPVSFQDQANISFQLLLFSSPGLWAGQLWDPLFGTVSLMSVRRVANLTAGIVADLLVQEMAMPENRRDGLRNSPAERRSARLAEALDPQTQLAAELLAHLPAV
jgi:hypothetical protein